METETKFGFLEEEEIAQSCKVPQITVPPPPYHGMRIWRASEGDAASEAFSNLPRVCAVNKPVHLARVLACCDTMLLEPNPASGDCQFWSLAQSLNNYQGSQLIPLRQRLAMLGLELGKVVAKDLRNLSYCSFLASHPDLDVHLERWKQLAADPTLVGSYFHGRFLAKKRIDTLTCTDRLVLFDMLMSPFETWGDETSLIILERLLAVRVDVICNSILQIRDPGHDEEPLVFVAMQLETQHYESIRILNKSDDSVTSAWAKHELPEELVAMHRRHCASSSKPWVQMSEDWFSADDIVRNVDGLVAHVIHKCLPILSTRHMTTTKPGAIRANPVFDFPDSDSIPDKDDESKPVLSGVSDRLVIAEGGWMDASIPHNRCIMLQCGVSLLNDRFSFVPSGRPLQRNEPVLSGDSSVIPGGAFVHLF